ncbi:MAG TPA: MOSC N-terminal beta barrel domain-containing protein [Pyrinomonadaceae bacterium]|nr:MOSC N-terminal beta barrel domain-containing protein [Pyrinomonadaceae bacterium]
MNISDINIYPIKSLAGVTVDSALVEDRGLQFDRRWMLVDWKRKFITQREVPRMAAVKIAVVGDGLTASIDGNTIAIPAHPATGKTATVKIWSSSVKAEFYPDEINHWFSNLLETGCRLVLMPETTKRKVNPFYAVRRFEDTVSFADGYPFLLIGEGSLEELNSRLERPVPMNRFRPNFVVAGSEPFAEDDWRRIRIGSSEFYVVKPCGRCVITTVDQATGKIDGKDPLKTLSTFRNRNGKVLFGQNLIAHATGGTIRNGDDVEVLERK